MYVFISKLFMLMIRFNLKPYFNVDLIVPILFRPDFGANERRSIRMNDLEY